MNSEVGMWHAELKRNVLRQPGMKQSFFPTSIRQSSSQAAFRIRICIVLILIFAPWVLWADETQNADIGSLSASLDQESVPVGGLIWLTLDYRLPEGGQLPEKLEIKGLDGISVIKQTINPGQIQIQLLVDHLGPWQSEPISLMVLDSKGQTQTLTGQPISIQAVSNLSGKAEEAELQPIRDIVAIGSIWQSYLLWLAIFVAVVMIGLGLFWFYKKRQTPSVLSQYMEPADIRARRELRGLETQQYFEKGLVKPYYFIFSEILRRYLESIRNFPAAEFTTEEISQSISAEQDRKLITLLRQADLVKFADTVPTQARKEADIKAALAYIRETSPQLEITQGKEDQREVQK